MAESVYHGLAEALAMRGGTLPVLKCRELLSLLEELFTPEEAGVAASMPVGQVTAEHLAQATPGKDATQVAAVLESLANKGIAFSAERDGAMVYTLMPVIPGIFEMQFMKGEVSERTRRLARLFDDYFSVASRVAGEQVGSAGKSQAGFPFARVITVEQDIPSGVTVHPYDRVSDYIEQADRISVSICYCRHHGELLDHSCGKPNDVCLTFGRQAGYVAERGFGRAITKGEARDILDRSEEAGLVHCSSNTSEYVSFICNCCSCHCGIIRSIKGGVIPMGAVSSFIVTVDEGECSGCGSCVDRCQMEALTLDGEVVTRTAESCIGCGLCISVCPTEALKMESRDEALVPPQNQRALRQSIISALQQSSG